MRWALVTAALVVNFVPPAQACSTDSCRRWRVLEVTRSFPRDAAVVLEGSYHREICVEDLRANAEVVVRRGDVVVPGTIDVPVNLYRELIWRPDALLEPGDHTITVTIDNAGIEASLGVPNNMCGEDVYSETLPFSVYESMIVTPEVLTPEVLAPPTFGTERRRLNGDWRSIACCPGVTPIDGIGSDCEPGIGSSGYAGDCIYFYDFDYLTITGAPLPLQYGFLYMYQLVVEGEVVDRGLGGTWARHTGRGCAHLEAIHLGTGEVIGSEVVCPPEDLVRGARPHEPEFALTCEQALACGTEDGWDPARCQPYVVGEPPFPPGPTRAETRIETACEAPVPVTTPMYPETDAGCGCTHAPGFGFVWLPVLLAPRRRRG